ncbi:MAG: GGDEF domain-containing protein [Chloroflexota bacterium]
MTGIDGNGNGPGLLPLQHAQTLRTLATDQVTASTEQTAQDADQTAQDSDQTASEHDDTAADSDQLAADRDQGAADRDQQGGTPNQTRAASYERSREDREASTHARLLSHAARVATADTRDLTAATRDAIAKARDDSARRRDARADAIDQSLATSSFPVDAKLQLLRAQAAADRARAAADRDRAAADRVLAALERKQLEDRLRTAHLDDLTGAYRRGMGRLAISNEIDRARRTDGRFVLAFVDVDDMKGINDRDGHAAGDLVLQALVRIIQSKLRPFDPVIRYGGDEFLCGLGGLDLADAEVRFRDIDGTLKREVGSGISVGLATLRPGETPDQLTARADEALLQAKPRRVTG